MKYNTNKLKESIEFISVLDASNINYKKQGKNHIISCPFHDEKTPSCAIDNNLNTFHCYGCNESGDIITFIQKYYNLSFMDAVKWLVREFNLENIIEENEEERYKRNEKENGWNFMDKVKKQYHTNLLGNENALNYLLSRGITMETIQKFEIGYAPDEFNCIVKYAKKHQEFDLAVKCGVILVNERNRDFFINRIIIPIHNRYGKCIGFSGRIWEDKQEVKKEPKYINSPETYLYKKHEVLFGLNLALSEIHKKDEVILVEGYFDVIRSHQENLQNVLASCGTSITEDQIKTLISLSNVVIMAGDNDKAGQKSIKTNIDEFYKLGMSRLEIVLWSDKIKDIDDFWTNNGSIDNLYNSKIDALEWLVQDLISTNPNLYEMNAMIEKLALLLSYIKEDFIRDGKITNLSKLLKAKPKVLDNIVKKHLKEQQSEQQTELDSNQIKYQSFFTKENIDEIEKHGFASIFDKENPSITGIHCKNNYENIVLISNFVLYPVYHVRSANIQSNKRLFCVENNSEKEIIEFENGTLTSSEKFSAIVNSKNNFMWYGTTLQLKRIMAVLCVNISKCYELKTLGWQNEGFFAFNNLFYSDGIINHLNEYGIGKHRDKLYYSPSQAVNLNELRDDNNDYEGIEFLTYVESKINFEEWCDLMMKTYLENGKYAILFIFNCIFRDIVLKVDQSCPHLYVWGPPGSGKSKMMESICSFFYNKKRVFQLNSGTDFAFSKFLSVFKNCFSFLNELDDSTVNPLWLQMIKGAYDNEGRQRGKGGSKNLTETMNVNSALGLAGQRIISSDDNALPMRCIIREFKLIENEIIPQSQLKAYSTLKKLENEGGFNSLILEILKEREFFEAHFESTFSDVFDEVRTIIIDNKYSWNERIAKNYCYLLTMNKLAQQKFKLPFSYIDMKNEVVKEIHNATKLHTSNDDLSKFWLAISNSNSIDEFKHGYDYKIENIQGECKLENGTKYYPIPKRLLFLILNRSHSIYRTSLKRETNEIGLELIVLKKYLLNKDYFEGTLNQKRFKQYNKINLDTGTKNTSCYVFDYDKLEKLGYYFNTND